MSKNELFCMPHVSSDVHQYNSVVHNNILLMDYFRLSNFNKITFRSPASASFKHDALLLSFNFLLILFNLPCSATKLERAREELKGWCLLSWKIFDVDKTKDRLIKICIHENLLRVKNMEKSYKRPAILKMLRIKNQIV